jgi:D-amino-acid oxidase
MQKSIAIIGAGVSGLTCAVLFAERGYRTAIFAEEIGQRTTSGAAGALWFPYDAGPADKVIPWALETYKVLVDLSRDSRSGVSMIELRQFSRTREIQIPDWAHSLGASVISSGSVMSSEVETSLNIFRSGFALTVPLMDTTIYLDYLANRFIKAGGSINEHVRFKRLQDVDLAFDVVINCAGIGARTLVNDIDLEPHRGQVAIVPKIDNLNCAIVCDDDPLMYAIPRTNDCVFGGTNEVSDNLAVDLASTTRIIAECSRVLREIDPPKDGFAVANKTRVLTERVGLRPFRKSGVRLEQEKLHDGRTVIHNYGHGGSGFTLSWGCAEEVFRLSRRQACANG